MASRILVDELVKKKVHKHLLRSQDLFYLSLLGKKDQAKKLLNIISKDYLPLGFGSDDLENITLTPMEIGLILENKFSLKDYIRQLKLLKHIAPYVHDLEHQNEAIEYLKARVKKIESDIQVYGHMGIGLVGESIETRNSDNLKSICKGIYFSLSNGEEKNNEIELDEEDENDYSRLEDFQLLLDFEDCFTFLCKLMKKEREYQIDDADAIPELSEFVFNYQKEQADLMLTAIKCAKPFDLVTFQILDFDDEVSGAGFAVKQKLRWEECKFRYVMHIQDYVSLYNFMVPLNSSSYDSVGDLLKFWFLLFRRPKEMNFDGLDTPECMAFLKKLSKLLDLKISLKIDAIGFKLPKHKANTDDKENIDYHILHLETLIASSIKFFSSTAWPAQLPVLCKVLNNLTILGENRYGDNYLDYSRPAELFLNNGDDDLSSVIKEEDLKTLLRLWEEEESGLEDKDVNDPEGNEVGDEGEDDNEEGELEGGNDREGELEEQEGREGECEDSQKENEILDTDSNGYERSDTSELEMIELEDNEYDEEEDSEVILEDNKELSARAAKRMKLR